VVIDTLARATTGGNENSGEDMGIALASCKAIHDATGALVCLIHHSGKDPTRGMRGWSGLLGAVDAELEITHNKDGSTRTVWVKKMRDGEDHFKLFDFELEPVPLGYDEDADEISSEVVKKSSLSS